MTAFAAPSFASGGRLHFAFDEDELTLAWDAVHVAKLPHGAALRAEGVQLPAWWWTGTGLRQDAQAGLTLRLAQTLLGPVAFVDDGSGKDPEALAHAALALAPAAELARVQAAREAPDTEADAPLGAFVLPSRHEQVTAERMRLPPGRVVSWTTIGAGAAPTEFLRLQDAVGAYHVVLVEAGGKRTVGLWDGGVDRSAPRVGQACRPVLRRLFRTQGAWRHGIKFAPMD